ncbi:MAG: 5-dehydro-4-deoxy-D-glucuronate isomerase [Spirochaetaceae bacterium]|nr:5-dehydro-4-deoxy-D-glucuronate isomerase [Spirochaetaceae bacterium]
MRILRDVHPDHYKKMDNSELREKFLIQDLFNVGKLDLVYLQADRMIVGSAIPTGSPLKLEGGKEIASDYFLERRELGIINIGNTGTVTADGIDYKLECKEALYLGRGVKEISFKSADSNKPAHFYLNSAPAHTGYPSKHITFDIAKKVEAGTAEEGNVRVINQLIHPAILETCQLLMGLTELAPGSMWNTMPTHTHDRRMEAYLYFNIDNEKQVVFHMMGEPHELKQIVVRDRQVVFSPSWSIHSGVGTRNYSFIWGMVGENQVFTDMDHLSFDKLG